MRCLFALLLSLAAVAAPVPKKIVADYFPVALGSKWEYAVEGQTATTYTDEVTKLAEKDGVRTVEVTTTAHSTDDATVIVHVYRVDADGVAMTDADGKELSPPRLDLRAKPTAEDKWDGPHEWKGWKYTLTTTVGKEEKVEVPTGEFRALPHTQAFALGDMGFPPLTAWYAPGVGVVKRTTERGETLVLVKYTPGKGK